jgi:type II secretory pathway component PulC
MIFAFQQWHNDWSLAHQEITHAANVTAKDETADMIAAIPDEHIFGQNLVDSGNMPITNLQLRVTGIVKVETEDAKSVSKAYISISGQPGKIYQAGDSLPYGVKVYDITPDTVILENDGHLEKLPLPRERLQFKQRNTEEQ